MEPTLGKSVELLVTGNECSVFLLFSIGFKMDHLSFVFSLLLIFSVTTPTFGYAIKANNPNGEVKQEFTHVIAYDQTFRLQHKGCVLDKTKKNYNNNNKPKR